MHGCRQGWPQTCLCCDEEKTCNKYTHCCTLYVAQHNWPCCAKSADLLCCRFRLKSCWQCLSVVGCQVSRHQLSAQIAEHLAKTLQTHIVMLKSHVSQSCQSCDCCYLCSVCAVLWCRHNLRQLPTCSVDCAGCKDTALHMSLITRGATSSSQ